VHFCADLPRALPVDSKEDVYACREHLLNGGPGRTVVIAKYFRMLKECIVANHGFELVMIYKEVVFTVHFTGTRRARGM